MSIKAILTTIGLLFSTMVFAQQAAVAVKIAAARPVQVVLAGLKHISIKATGHDNMEHEYTGVLLADVLIKAGAVLGEQSKKETIVQYILIRAADNYKTIFALAELDPLFTSDTIILADKQDGKALPAGNGPFQVVAPRDKKHARWIRQVVSLDLFNAD